MVILRSTPDLILTRENPGALFTEGGVEFRDPGDGDLTGFYDWLRGAGGAVIGVRYWPLREVRFPRSAIDHLPYVRVSQADPSIEIYFSAERDFDPELSSDQDFGDNAVFASDTSEYAIAFGAHWLTDADLATLESCGARWSTLDP